MAHGGRRRGAEVKMAGQPISTGLGVLEALEGSIGELRDEASRVRPTADDRAPDGGRWFPWAPGASRDRHGRIGGGAP